MAEPALMQRLSPNQTVEETGLATRTTSTTELAPTSAAAEVTTEIQGAIIVARRFPRNEDQAYGLLMRSCQRTSFAEDASYSFPRGKTKVEGPSVRLAREAARVWGNVRYGLDILRDDDDSRDIQGWAWDVQTNTKVTAGDSFRKLIQRKQDDGSTRWVKPDERDLRELTNRRGAILVRNCLLQILPSDLVEDALEQAASTLRTRAEQDPDGERKKVIVAFGALNVTPEMLEAYLKHPVVQCTPAEIADLKRVYASLRDGNSNWSDYVEREKKEPEKGNLDLGGVKGKEVAARDQADAGGAKNGAAAAAATATGDEAPMSEAERKDLELRAQKKGMDGDALEACCQLTCNKALAELNHADVNKVVLAIAKLQQQGKAK